VSTAQRRAQRADIADPVVQPGANSWQSGQTVQTVPETRPFVAKSRDPPARGSGGNRA
jgi:hypothetical protein